MTELLNPEQITAIVITNLAFNLIWGVLADVLGPAW